MASSDPARRRRRAALAAAAVALLVVAGLGLAGALGLLGADETPAPPPGSPTAPPSPSSTPLADVDTAALTVERASFCDAVEADAVGRALGLRDGAPDVGEEDLTRWENGERARLEDGLRDVAHEYGCSWSGPRGRTAEAWVFAPPVTRREARSVASSWAGQRGCTVAEDAPGLGRPSTTVDCRAGGRREHTVAGLLGDAWLTCRVGGRVERATRADLAEQGSTWCSAVLAAAAAPTSAG